MTVRRSTRTNRAKSMIVGEENVYKGWCSVGAKQMVWHPSCSRSRGRVYGMGSGTGSLVVATTNLWAVREGERERELKQRLMAIDE